MEYAGASPFLPFLLMLLAQCLFWALVIAAVVWFVLWLARRTDTVGAGRESPLDILKARYARGDITREQYEEMRRTLEES